MKLLLKNCTVYRRGVPKIGSIAVDNGVIADEGSVSVFDKVYDLNNLFVFPGFVDVHVHFREPGFSYKETIRTGSLAAAWGGYTDVCTMPNLNPAPDSVENIRQEIELIKHDAAVNVHPYASITMGQRGEGSLVDFDQLSPYAIGFSDDGKGVKSEEIMLRAMEKCKKAGKVIAAHCEDTSLIPNGGAIHMGEYAQTHNIPGIPSESEWKMIERDISLCEKTGCKYHVCHVSCKESVELIRSAKSRGVNITCETAPHYLLLSQDNLQDEGRFKMNPPLRNEEDRAALIDGIRDGTIDMIATDHAPHSMEEKNRGLANSLMGIVGLETAFPLLFTYLAKPGIVPFERILEMLTYSPRKRFDILGGIEPGEKAAFTIWDMNCQGVIDSSSFLSMGRSTPFDGWHVDGKCIATIVGDKTAYMA